VKAAGDVNAFASEFLANMVGAVYATLYEVLDEVGAVKCWRWCEGNDWRFMASH
jgi:hypothetical protein